MNIMRVNGLSVGVNLPVAPKGEHIVHGLPPYCPAQVHVVDEYPACPVDWMHGSAKASSYFIGVEPGRHLWLDFNPNWAHKHHIAVVLSVQGINPITYQKTSTLRLEQYRERCPVHKTKFKQDRFCKKCKFKWPSQNYLTTTSCPIGQFWIDGFRMPDGQIRGFLITEETVRGMAKQIIGDDRVFAIGIAFYLSKEPKPQPQQQQQITDSGWFGYAGTKKYMAPPHTSWQLVSTGVQVTNSTKSSGISGSSLRSITPHSVLGVNRVESLSKVPIAGETLESMSCEFDGNDSVQIDAGGMSVNDSLEVQPKKLEIAGGAKIYQDLDFIDNNELSFYQDEPVGLIYINYTTPESVKQILAAGKRQEKKEGVMDGLLVGNG